MIARFLEAHEVMPKAYTEKLESLRRKSPDGIVAEH
jgi:hypothetical protein